MPQPLISVVCGEVRVVDIEHRDRQASIDSPVYVSMRPK